MDLFSELGALLLSIIEAQYYPLFLKTPFYKRFMQIKVLENLEQIPDYYEHIQVCVLFSHSILQFSAHYLLTEFFLNNKSNLAKGPLGL